MKYDRLICYKRKSQPTESNQWGTKKFPLDKIYELSFHWCCIGTSRYFAYYMYILPQFKHVI